jgi:hypothetical protein
VIDDEEEEGRRTLEVLYKGPRFDLASVGLDASQSIHIKLSIYRVILKAQKRSYIEQRAKTVAKFNKGEFRR